MYHFFVSFLVGGFFGGITGYFVGKYDLLTRANCRPEGYVHEGSVTDSPVRDDPFPDNSFTREEFEDYLSNLKKVPYDETLAFIKSTSNTGYATSRDLENRNTTKLRREIYTIEKYNLFIRYLNDYFVNKYEYKTRNEFSDTLRRSLDGYEFKTIYDCPRSCTNFGVLSLQWHEESRRYSIYPIVVFKTVSKTVVNSVVNTSEIDKMYDSLKKGG